MPPPPFMQGVDGNNDIIPLLVDSTGKVLIGGTVTVGGTVVVSSVTNPVSIVQPVQVTQTQKLTTGVYAPQLSSAWLNLWNGNAPGGGVWNPTVYTVPANRRVVVHHWNLYMTGTFTVYKIGATIGGNPFNFDDLNTAFTLGYRTFGLLDIHLDPGDSLQITVSGPSAGLSAYSQQIGEQYAV